MGRSVSRFDPASAPERLDGNTVVRSQESAVGGTPSDGLVRYYAPVLRNDSLFQQEWQLDSQGAKRFELEYPVEWVVGSGNATRSYLINVNGYVTEAPLTWYVDREIWDMSPGYEQTNDRFSRPITLECMTCHNSIPDLSEGTVNHYNAVPLGIGCERCHGPGDSHVERQLAGLGLSESLVEIVNPATLDRDRQLSVCQQCHLTGVSVFKPGHDATTFRPGMLLAEHRTVFEDAEDAQDEEAFGIASHGTRLAKSECYRLSDMTCTTCHDPHVPLSELKTDYINTECASCHSGSIEDSNEICSRDDTPVAQRMTGDCVSCHMKVGGTSDIPHVSFTDHWIRRTIPGSVEGGVTDETYLRDAPVTLVRVSPELAGESLSQKQVDEAIAYFSFYETVHRHPGYLPRIIGLAQQGISAGGSIDDDVSVALVLGRSLLESGKPVDAITVLEEAAAAFPQDPMVRFHLGTAYLQTGDRERARVAFESATTLQPLLVESQLKLGSVLDAGGRSAEAIEVLQRALANDPVHNPGGWNNLGFIHLQAGDSDRAIAAFETAVGLDSGLLEARLNLGSAHLFGGDMDTAEAVFLDVIVDFESAKAGYGNLGVIYGRRGDLDRARQMFEKVLELDPSDPNASNMLRQMDEL